MFIISELMFDMKMLLLLLIFSALTSEYLVGRELFYLIIVPAAY